MVHFTSNVSENVYLGKGVVRSMANSGGCYIQGINGIFIGDHTIFAPGVKMISANHEMHEYAGHKKDGIPIKIGERCWIGANAVILPKVVLGNDVIVAAGAVVSKSFPSKVIIGGVPAKVIGANKTE